MNINKYLDLITDGIAKPKMMSLVESVIKPAVDCGSAVESFELAFSLDNAVGEQLDIIGDIVGVSRMIPFVPTTGDRKMSDDEYRIVLMLGIAKDNWDGTMRGVYDSLKGVFGENMPIKYIDNQNMSVDIEVYNNLTQRMLELISASDVMLIPMGVSKNVALIGGEVGCTAYVYGAISGIEWEDSVNAD